jgi:hypothetical protein
MGAGIGGIEEASAFLLLKLLDHFDLEALDPCGSFLGMLIL